MSLHSAAGFSPEELAAIQDESGRLGIRLIVWGTLVYLTGYVSLASIVAATMLPILVLAFRAPLPVFWLSAGLAAFVVYAHRANIGRLLRGEEHRFRRGVREAR